MKVIQYKMPDESSPLSIASEPEVMYLKNKGLSLFDVARFQDLSQKLLFTQMEWADILHISDRTLQRYLKENKSFEGLHAEHLYQLDNMANLGLSVFSNARLLEQWLSTSKTVLGQLLDFSALKSFWGVKLICNELGRIEHGIYI